MPERNDGEVDGDHSVDPDADARREALAFMARRAAVWTVPLGLVGLLLIGLGIPWWISVLATLVVLAVVVFEIDL